MMMAVRLEKRSCSDGSYLTEATGGVTRQPVMPWGGRLPRTLAWLFTDRIMALAKQRRKTLAVESLPPPPTMLLRLPNLSEDGGHASVTDETPALSDSYSAGDSDGEEEVEVLPGWDKVTTTTTTTSAVHPFAWNPEAAPWVPVTPLHSDHDTTTSVEAPPNAQKKRSRRKRQRRSRGQSAASLLLNGDRPVPVSPGNGTCYPAPASYADPLTTRRMIYPASNDYNIANPGPAAPFSVMSWNVLSQQYVRGSRFFYTSDASLDADYRTSRILQHIITSHVDIVALQEVDELLYHRVLLPALHAHGYAGVYERKRHATLQDGCAVLYRTDRFSLRNADTLHYQEAALHDPTVVDTAAAAAAADATDDLRAHQRDRVCRFNMHHNLALIVLLWDRCTGRSVRIANTHLLADPTYADAKLLQTALLCERVERECRGSRRYAPANSPSGDADKSPPLRTTAPVILCGDWNSLPESDVMAYLLRGRVHRRAFDGHNFGRFTRRRILRHRLGLACAYAAAGTKMSATARTAQFTGEIDRILYTQHSSLRVVSVLGDLSRPERRWMPNEHMPSDHLPLVAVFADTRFSAPLSGVAPFTALPFTRTSVPSASYNLLHPTLRWSTARPSALPVTPLCQSNLFAIPSTDHGCRSSPPINTIATTSTTMIAGAAPVVAQCNATVEKTRTKKSSTGRYRGARGRRGGRKVAQHNAAAAAAAITQP